MALNKNYINKIERRNERREKKEHVLYCCVEKRERVPQIMVN